MAFDISEIMEKLKSIESFAAHVAETKKLADQLAENFAKMKTAINQTINDSFTEIANQIDTLRKTMEEMETAQAAAKKVETAAAESAATPAAETEPAAEPVAEPALEPEAEVESAPETEVEAEPAVEPEAVPEEEAEVEEAPAEGGDQLDFLLQQKDRLKAALTDLRFDYMRGYIPEDEYKTKESELDSQLEDLDRQIASMK